MAAVLTGGRYPAYGQVREHYAREDFLELLLQTTRARKVVLVIPETKYWEPRWDVDRVQGRTVDEVGRWVLERLDRAFAGAPPDERLPFYPSFHQSLERWGGASLDGSPVEVDGVLESDQPTWRESFHDVLTLAEVLEAERVPYRLKFSGHRSLHLVVPGAQARLQPGVFGQSNAHGARLLRMPFSLNEDTGLVSLPLRRVDLPAFRPWQAALPLADECRAPEWLDAPDEEARARLGQFLASLKQHRPVDRCPYFAAADIVAGSRQRLAALAARTPAVAAPGTARQRAWGLLLRERALAPDEVEPCLTDSEPDARWLAAEALLLRGREFPARQLPSLLDSDDSYVRSALIDLVEHFVDESCALFAAELRRPELVVPARWLHLLAQSPGLRDRVVRELAGAPGGVGLRVACVTGVHLGRWPDAWEIAAREGAPACAADPLARRLDALRLMEAMERAHNWGVRAARARELAALGSDVIDLVLLAQASPHRRTARAFLIVLAEMGDPRGLDALVRGLGTSNCGAIAVRGLKRIGTLAVPALLEAANSDDVRTRRHALRCLAYLRDPRAWPTLVAGLQDADDRARREAVRGLHHPAPAMGALVEAARIGSERGMQSAAYAAVEALASGGKTGEAAIHQLAFAERNLFAAAWLAAQGDLQARAILVDALGEAPPRRREAALLWAELGPDTEVLGAVVSCLAGLVPWQQWPILRGLAVSGLPEAAEAIIARARNGGSVERRTGVWALGLCRDPRVPAAIVEMAIGPDAKVRQAAMDAAMAQARAVAPVVAAMLASAERAFPGRRSLEGLRRCLAVKERLECGEAFTLDLVRAIAHSPKPLWDAARKRVAEDTSGQTVEQLHALAGQANTPVVRFCVSELLAAASEEEQDDAPEVAQEE